MPRTDSRVVCAASRTEKEDQRAGRKPREAALTLTDLNWSRVFDRKVCKISFTSFAGEMREKIQATGSSGIRISNAVVCQIGRFRDSLSAVPQA